MQNGINIFYDSWLNKYHTYILGKHFFKINEHVTEQRQTSVLTYISLVNMNHDILNVTCDTVMSRLCHTLKHFKLFNSVKIKQN